MITCRQFVVLLLISSLLRSCKAMHSEDKKGTETSQVYLYRLINWCIIGRGEYTLNEWPLSQFKPILHQTYKNEIQHSVDSKDIFGDFNRNNETDWDPWKKYDLQFSPINCKELTGKGLGDDTGNLLQRIHVQFRPQSETDLVPFQGLLIQAVHAPFGIGFPFGVFDTNQEFECSDCKHFHFSRIVGCLSRPDISTMHPTVAMFHYKLRGPKPIEKKEDGASAPTDSPPSESDASEIEYGYQSELHWNFKWGNIPCSSARMVEFWVLMVIDFERRAWTAKKFGPYDLNAFASSSAMEEPKMLTINEINIVQPGLPTPILPDCFPFKRNPLIIGEQGRPHSCFRNYKSYDPLQCERWERKIRLPISASSTTPATSVSTGSPVAAINDVFKNNMMCEEGAIALEVVENRTRVRIAGDFDVSCTRRYPGKLYEKLHTRLKRQPYKLCPEWQGRFRCGGKDDDLHFDTVVREEGPFNDSRAFPGSHCIKCKDVTEEITQPPSDKEPFFKRAEHGVFMIYAFFFFNPVSLNVARFYKETLHEKQTKGWRLWLIIHVGFAAFASIFSYIGYTYPSFKDFDAHITLGYGAMIGVSSGVVTGWCRHKNPIIQTVMFYVHALSGYLGWGLAIASMVFAPFISKWTRLVSYMASAICLLAMAIMTFHICSVDSGMGVRPSRSHIPIIEIRFDDIVPPKSKFRKIFLYVYIFLQFLICFGMLVL